jgi:hypothetical protein
MTIDQIFAADIELIANMIEKNNNDCHSILSSVNGEVERQHIDVGYDKVIVRNVSDKITMAVIDCKEQKIKSITFYGKIEISRKELLEMFPTYRKAMSFRDNLYFYFFNEEKRERNYIVSFSEDPAYSYDSNSRKGISNLTLSWE